MEISKDEHAALINAANLLCEHVSKHLPEGWEITLSMMKDEASLSLGHPEGLDVDTGSSERGRSHIHDVCELAIEIDAEESEEGDD